MKHLDGLSAKDDITWESVFERWKHDEHADPAWEKSWRSKGFASWDEWRSHRSDALKLSERAWTLAHVDQPLRTVPGFHGGPFQTWIEKYYSGAIGLTFEELTTKGIRDNARVRNILERFPAETRLVGLLWRQRMLIYEGMHRSCAIAIAAADGLPLETDVSLAYADISDVTEEELRRIAALREKAKEGE